MIDFSFTSKQTDLREEIVAFAQTHLNEEVAIQDRDQIFDRELWTKCGEIGLPGLSIPEEYEGRGLTALDTVIALEALGYGSENAGFNFAIAAHLLACAMPIYLYGSAEQKSQYLPSLCNGQQIATNAMTEASSGSDVYQMTSEAKMDGANFRLTGHKTYCSNGPVADVVLTYALTNPDKGFFGGITAFVLEKGKHDYRVGERIDKLGLRSCQLSELFFEDSLLGPETVLGQAGGGGSIFQKSMEWERICLGALHIGEMDRLMKKAIAFAKKRRAVGQAISSFQAVAHPLADLHCQIESCRLYLYKTAWQLDQKQKVQQAASMTKLMISETYQKFAIQLNQLFAGAAFKAPNEIERCLRDSMAATIYSGTSEIQRNLIARYMGLK